MGLGQRICIASASAGANVVGTARRSCKETEDKIRELGGNFTELIADLSDFAVIPRIMKEASKAYGRVDILVNNAGVIKRCGAVDVTLQDWELVVDLNQKMVFFLSQAFAKTWIADQGGERSLISPPC